MISPMLPKWLDTRQATAVGKSLAEDFTLRTEPLKMQKRKRGGIKDPEQAHLQGLMQKFLLRVDREARPLKLNTFQRAKLANAFKWELIDKGIDRQLVNELTQALVMRLAGPGPAAAPKP
jgi:hypothetical protein